MEIHNYVPPYAIGSKETILVRAHELRRVAHIQLTCSAWKSRLPPPELQCDGVRARRNEHLVVLVLEATLRTLLMEVSRESGT